MPTFADVLESAAVGDVLQAELVPLTNQGKLRVTYNWQYSALNCDPNDGSTFEWTLNKVNATTVTLSPSAQYAGMTLFASVRDDWSWFVQTQAPYSADWITQAQGDEMIGLQAFSTLIVSFTGFNGQYIAVNSQLTDDGQHAGYRLQSSNPSTSQPRMFFLGPTQLLQSGIELPLASTLDEGAVAAEIQLATGQTETALATRVAQQLETTPTRGEQHE
jgi:hypothetical protein